MARPQVADGGTASNVEGSCEYIEQAILDSRQGVIVAALGLGELLTTRLKNVRPGPILWCDVSNENGT
jgi:hypothetical protein